MFFMKWNSNKLDRNNKFNGKKLEQPGQLYKCKVHVKCYNKHVTDELDDGRDKFDFLVPFGTTITFIENVQHGSFRLFIGNVVYYKFFYDNKTFFVGWDDLQYLELIND